MKKLFAVLLAVLMLAACAPAESSVPQSSQTESQTISVESVLVSVAESLPEISSAAAAPTMNELILAYDAILKQAFKGLEIYCWTADGAAMCGVLPGTNRIKTEDDFAYLYRYSATPEQMAQLVKNLDEETYLLVIPMTDADIAAADAVYNLLNAMTFYNLSRLDAAFSDEMESVNCVVGAARTEDWSDFSIVEGEEWGVCISLPSYIVWDGEGTTTFMNQRNGVKFMELWPVVFMGEGGVPYDKAPAESDEEEDTVVLQQNFSLPNASGVLRVTESYPSGGAVEVWYPHTYWVTMGDYALGVTLYSLEADGSDTALFERIVNSVSFLPSGMGM